MTKDNHLRGILFLLGSGVVFTILDSLAKETSTLIPVLQVAWGRYVFHVVFLPFYAERPVGSPLWSAARWARMFATRHPWLQILRSLLLLGATLFFFGAVSYVPLAEAQAVAFVEPLLITAIAHFFLAERIGIRRWLAIIVAFAGVLIVIHPGFGMLHWGMLLSLGSAGCGSIYSTLTRIVSREDSAGTSLAYAGLAGFVGLSLAMPFVWQPASAHVWMLFFALGISGGLGHYLMIKAFGNAPGGTLAPFIYVQMLWMVIIGWLWFDDWPALTTWIGIAFIVGSGLYALHRERIRAREQARISTHA
ncbi:MAG TPA: DMT family transporter [Dongiaceae bacterium]|nr:DMT family transporter [Dongiaceae bacterium]